LMSGSGSWTELFISSPFVVHLEGEGGYGLLLALREPRVRALSPPGPEGSTASTMTPCGELRFSYTLDVPRQLQGTKGLDIYAELIAKVAVNVLTARICMRGSTSVSDALAATRDKEVLPLEGLAYAISLGGAVLTKRSEKGSVALSRWQLPDYLSVLVKPSGNKDLAHPSLLEIMSKVLTARGTKGVLCRCTDARLGLEVALGDGETAPESYFVTGIDNSGAEATLL